MQLLGLYLFAMLNVNIDCLSHHLISVDSNTEVARSGCGFSIRIASNYHSIQLHFVFGNESNYNTDLEKMTH